MTPEQKAKALMSELAREIYNFKGKCPLDGLTIMGLKPVIKCALIAQKNLLDKLSKLGIEDKFELEVYNQINAL